MVRAQLTGVTPRLAERMAMGAAMDRVTNREPMVRYRVLIPTRMISVKTGRPVRVDVPRFPLIRLPSHAKYWAYQGADPPRLFPEADAA